MNENRSTGSKSKFDTKKFKSKFGELISHETEKWFDIIREGIKKDEIQIRVNPHNGEFGVRKNGKSAFKDLRGAHFYDELFDQTYDRSHNSWFIRKSFKDYSDINSELINDLENFITKLNEEKNQ